MVPRICRVFEGKQKGSLKLCLKLSSVFASHCHCLLFWWVVGLDSHVQYCLLTEHHLEAILMRQVIVHFR